MKRDNDPTLARPAFALWLRNRGYSVQDAIEHADNPEIMRFRVEGLYEQSATVLTRCWNVTHADSMVAVVMVGDKAMGFDLDSLSVPRR